MPGLDTCHVRRISALTDRGTWDLVDPTLDFQHVGCRFIYIIKHHPDGNVEKLKARLVTKGYTQTLVFIILKLLLKWFVLILCEFLFLLRIVLNGLFDSLMSKIFLYENFIGRRVYGATNWVCNFGGVNFFALKIYGLKQSMHV